MNQKGFVKIAVGILLLIIAATGFIFKDKIQNWANGGGNQITTDSNGLGVFRSDAFGIEVHYDSNIWIPALEISDVRGGQGVNSKEVNSSVPTFNSPKYYVHWIYSSDNSVLQAYQGGCLLYGAGDPDPAVRDYYKGKIEKERIEIKTAGGVPAQGCKTRYFSSDPNMLSNILEDLYLIHPLTRKEIGIRIMSGPGVEKNRVDEIFNASESVIKTMSFYQPTK